MRESFIEEKLTKAVKQNGGVCWKFTSPGTAGVPDRIILMPEGRIAFVEVKAPGEKPRPLQQSRHRLLRRLGFKVYVLDTLEDIEKIISEVKNDGVT
ncbi:MAG: VRR-NUC domain-containing protein [Oscillospiraceae bacterium]|nr:VRR-NUC domain-containing protein [Oscillospiraceae bacterium]